jgi:hypothetical protein
MASLKQIVHWKPLPHFFVGELLQPLCVCDMPGACCLSQ